MYTTVCYFAKNHIYIYCIACNPVRLYYISKILWNKTIFTRMLNNDRQPTKFNQETCVQDRSVQYKRCKHSQTKFEWSVMW